VARDGERVGHRDVERELDGPEVRRRGTGRLGCAPRPRDHLGQREEPLVVGRHAERVPGRHAVTGQVARRRPFLQARERRLQPVVHCPAGPLGELCLGVVDVVTVHSVDPQVRQRAVELVVEELRRDAVLARDQVVLVDDAGVDVLPVDPPAGVVRAGPVERDEPALGRDDDRLPVDDGVVVGIVGRVRRFSQVCADADAGDDGLAEPPEVRACKAVVVVPVGPGRLARCHTVSGDVGGKTLSVSVGAVDGRYWRSPTIASNSLSTNSSRSMPSPGPSSSMWLTDS